MAQKRKKKKKLKQKEGLYIYRKTDITIAFCVRITTQRTASWEGGAPVERETCPGFSAVVRPRSAIQAVAGPEMDMGWVNPWVQLNSTQLY